MPFIGVDIREAIICIINLFENCCTNYLIFNTNQLKQTNHEETFITTLSCYFNQYDCCRKTYLFCLHIEK